MNTSRTVTLMGGALALGLGTAAQATSTAAHAMVVSGYAGHVGGSIFACSTSGPQAREGHYFGSSTVGLPLEGYSYCGLAGGIQDTSNAAGPSTASQSVSNFYSHGLHDQTAMALADFGVLKASSKGSYGGDAIGGFSYHDGEAAAYSTDTLPTPAGAAFVQFGLSIDGAASITGTSQVITILDYQINSGPIYGAFNANLEGNTFAILNGLNGTGGGPVAGFTVVSGSTVGGIVTPASVSGSGTVTSFLSDVTPGTFDLTLALLTSSFPTNANSLSPTGGSADNDFSETIRLSSLQFFDGARNPIAFGTLTGASGRLYDADGVHTAPVIASGTPEPAAWALMVAGFGLVGGATRRRARTRPVAV